LITRGTPTPADDIQLLKGQTYLSVSSESEGSTFVTCVAPNAEGWDKRRKSTIINWVDAIWAIPVPMNATAGTVHPLTTVITRNSDNSGVEGWKVRYTIAGGAPAEFAPMGTQQAEVTSGRDGTATVQIRQIAGKFDPGATHVKIEIVRPRMFGEPELTVESGVTSVTWSAPALTIRAIGPKTAGVNESINYRIEISNPGDQVTRGVVLRTRDLPDSMEFISSDPKPALYGRQYEWQLGDIPPGAAPSVVNVQVRSTEPGTAELCFEVSSQSDQLRTEACAQTEISTPCIGLAIEGPTESRVGAQVSYNISVKNLCDEPLADVELTIQYDDGLDATGYPSPIRANMGIVAAGDQKTIPVLFDIMKAGDLCFTLNVVAKGGHMARETRCLKALSDSTAKATLQIEGRRRVEQGDRVLIRGTVTNVGDVDLRELTLTNRFSDSLEPIEVSKRYPHRWLLGENQAASDELIFDLGELKPGESAFVELVYQATKVDGNAFSEMTLSSPEIAPTNRRYDLRIERPGTIGAESPPETAPRIPDDDVRQPSPDERQNGSQLPSESGTNGSAPNIENRSPDLNGPMSIPDDDDNATARGNLAVTVETLNPVVATGGNALIRYSITNNASVEDRDIDISILIPPSLELINNDDRQNPLAIVSSSNDRTRFELNRRNSLRAGESMTFIATIAGRQPGQATFEVRAASANSQGTVTASDVVTVTQ
jgi:hypothetical protein